MAGMQGDGSMSGCGGPRRGTRRREGSAREGLSWVARPAERGLCPGVTLMRSHASA